MVWRNLLISARVRASCWQGYPAVMAPSDHVQGSSVSEPVSALPVSHLAATNPMLAGAVAAQQAGATGPTLLPLAGALPGAAAVHSNPSTAACPAVFVANIGHIGSDRDLKDLFNRYLFYDLHILPLSLVSGML